MTGKLTPLPAIRRVGMMLHVPKLTTPAIAAGYLRGGMDQPSIHVGTFAILRPWTRDDAPAVMEAFRDPSIQRWHIRRADSIDEARGLAHPVERRVGKRIRMPLGDRRSRDK